VSRWRALGERIRIRRWLAHCERVGSSVTLDGKPTVWAFGDGRIELGDRFTLSSLPMASHMVSLGLLRVGDDVAIGHGAAIAATVSITIGARTRIGPFFVVMDTDFHGERAKSGARPTTNTAINADSGFAPVTIGADVTIGAHVTVLRGTTIGDGATIAPGSVVNGEIPAGALAQGVPARVVTGWSDGDGGDAAVRDIVARVFGLTEAPGNESGPDDIPQWDSLGSLKLLLSIEDTLGISLSADVMAGVCNVGDLQGAVERARGAAFQ
jgi:acetyltransferase-like isoleucine patch superfamily enzyme/acyl carrier protein